MNLKHRIALVLVVVAAVWFAGSGVAAKSKRRAYHPTIDPANFVTGVDNPYFPLLPGTVFSFVETQGKRRSQNEVTVLPDTKVIVGVTCVVVHDVMRDNGGITEDTHDWYAQDKNGTVWYFGEDTREYHAHGKVSTEGSWQAGVDGAQPGVIMWGHPAAGEAYRQEYRAEKAEDMGQVVATDDSVTVPFGSFANCVRTKEWSRLEPGTEKKWYAKGVGVVRSESTEKEISMLVSVSRP